ncbi:hypothetical protein RJ641_028757 [Dillenia turbinata]|uniref:Uncharacterized protein n=1 Tax=Dillenia turbinata TaxID=194707 RepID=A0AAN8ZIJ2_9MAGN
MSKLRTDRKPPLPKTPTRLRPRRSTSTASAQTPPGSLTKTQRINYDKEIEESDLRPEYHSISCEFRALAKMVQEELGTIATKNAEFSYNLNANPSNPLFERGRFYEEYSAARNERLKKKKGETGDQIQKKTPYKLGVTVDSAKRKDTKKLESSLRKSVDQAPRYLLRSSTRENKKPPLFPDLDKSISERRVSTRRTRKI